MLQYREYKKEKKNRKKKNVFMEVFLFLNAYVHGNPHPLYVYVINVCVHCMQQNSKSGVSINVCVRVLSTYTRIVIEINLKFYFRGQGHTQESMKYLFTLESHKYIHDLCIILLLSFFLSLSLSLSLFACNSSILLYSSSLLSSILH